MNKSRLLKLADLLEAEGKKTKPKLGFNMSNWKRKPGPTDISEHDLYRRKCDTVACVGGSAEFYFGKFKPNENDGGPQAQAVLGLSDQDAKSLFYPGDAENDIGLLDNWDLITPFVAAECIRHFVKTGKIDYRRAIKVID